MNQTISQTPNAFEGLCKAFEARDIVPWSLSPDPPMFSRDMKYTVRTTAARLAVKWTVDAHGEITPTSIMCVKTMLIFIQINIKRVDLSKYASTRVEVPVS
jgi:hypothetical protein